MPILKPGKKSNSCPYCGNNPVPHFVYWYFESLNLLFAPLRQMVLFNPFALAIRRAIKRLNLERGILKVFEWAKIASWNDNIDLCKIPRAKVLWQEALGRGITMRELKLFGKSVDVYEAQRQNPLSFILYPLSKSSRIKDQARLPLESERLLSGRPARQGLKIFFSGLPRPENYNPKNLDLMDDKGWLKKQLFQAGLPVPEGGVASSLSQAQAIFERIQSGLKSQIPNPKLQSEAEEHLKPKTSNLKPVIVKPRAGSRGRHSTVFVKNLADLKQAFKIARQLCYWVVVEEMLQGPVYRATVINYELAGVLRGDQPQVAGDGIHNLKELIEIKNSRPHPGVKNVIIDAGMERIILRQISNIKFQISNNFLKNPMEFIPANNQTVMLSEKIGVNYGGSSSEDYEICHTDNKQVFVKAAQAIGDPIVGFDFIIPDISQSFKQQTCGFIEANSLPFINLHHDPLLGQPRNVAAKVWDMIESTKY